MFKLDPLPYGYDALAPLISEETLRLHYDKHHAGYLAKLNALVSSDASVDSSQCTLESLIVQQQHSPARQKIFDCAAQVFNHSFYWQCLRAPPPPSSPTAAHAEKGPCDNRQGTVAQAIRDSFGSFGSFKRAFAAEAVAHFGSGWCWLCRDEKHGQRLSIVCTHDADTPLNGFDGNVPLLTCDVWEHAYYVDYRNDRASYLDNFFKLVNWDFVEQQMKNDPYWLPEAKKQIQSAL